MTRKQAKNYLRCSGLSEEQIHAVISAFMSEDAVSREAVLDIVDGYGTSCHGNDSYENVVNGLVRATKAAMHNAIEKIPSVAPAMERGSWVPVDDEPHEDYECDRCGRMVYCEGDVDFEFKYCPECGAEMWEGESE